MIAESGNFPVPAALGWLTTSCGVEPDEWLTQVTTVPGAMMTFETPGCPTICQPKPEGLFASSTASMVIVFWLLRSTNDVAGGFCGPLPAFFCASYSAICVGLVNDWKT